MKEIAFNITPSTGDSPKVIIGTITMNVTIGNEEYQLKFEQPEAPKVPVKMKDRGNVMIRVDDVVLIRPSQDLNSKKSNNKQIILNGKGDDELCDFSARKDMDRHFGEYIDKFIRIDNAVWVNKKYIVGQILIKAHEKTQVKTPEKTSDKKPNKKPDKIKVVVSYSDVLGEVKELKLEVSSSNERDVKRLKLKTITD